jgi:large subunit ribosomal protein L28
MQTCAVCGKKPIVGRSIARRGLPKKTGGIGLKTTGITRRRFFPNLQKVKVRFPNGTVRRIRVCASCLQANKVTKAVTYKLVTAKPAA